MGLDRLQIVIQKFTKKHNYKTRQNLYFSGLFFKNIGVVKLFFFSFFFFFFSFFFFSFPSFFFLFLLFFFFSFLGRDVQCVFNFFKFLYIYTSNAKVDVDGRPKKLKFGGVSPQPLYSQLDVLHHQHANKVSLVTCLDQTIFKLDFKPTTPIVKGVDFNK